jgi:ribosome-associated protein
VRGKTDRGNSVSITFAIRGEYIQLDQLLKATGLCESGGAAHAAIAEGRVKVDATVDTRKRAKMKPGQIVSFAGEEVILIAEQA